MSLHEQFKLTRRYALEDVRSTWLLEPSTPLDDMLLALGLSIQSRGVNAENFTEFLTALAAGKYGNGFDLESQSKIESVLKEAVIEFDNDPPQDSPDGQTLLEYQTKLDKGFYENTFRETLILALGTMRFVSLAF